MATQMPSYGAYQQVYGQQPEQGGFMGLLSSPVAQGLLGAGLGALASRGTKAQAIGRGGLLGLSAYGQAQDTQNNRLLQMAQAKFQQDQLDKEQQKKDQIQGMIGNIFGAPGQSSAGTGPTAGGGLGSAGIDQIAALEALGGPKLLDHWKTAQSGVAQDGGKFYIKNGKTQYMPQVDKGMTFDQATGTAMAIPGYAGANAQIQGAQTQAQEAAKFPFTVSADQARQQTQAGLDAMQVTGQDGSTYFVPRSQVVGAGQGGQGAGAGGMPYMASRNPVNVQTDQRLNDNWITKTYQPTLDAADGARGMLSSIQAVRNLDLRTGWGTDAMSKGANLLVGLGLGGEEAQKLASNSQMFGSVAMDRLLKTLQMQAGPQTEGDATRAGQTWVSLQNTPQANEFILDFAEAQARQQARKAAFYERALPIAKNSGDLTEIDRKWRQISGSVWNDPLMQRWAKPKQGGANGAF